MREPAAAARERLESRTIARSAPAYMRNFELDPVWIDEEHGVVAAAVLGPDLWRVEHLGAERHQHIAVAPIDVLATCRAEREMMQPR